MVEVWALILRDVTVTKMRTTLSIAKTRTIRFIQSPVCLLIAAAIFHVLLTLSVFALGRYSVLPTTFDTNGIAVSIAPDGIVHREEAAQLGRALASGQFRDWLDLSSPFYLKLYSIWFAFLGPLFGSTILSAEPLNLFFYLTILVCTFYLGQEVLDRRAALIAAATIALWPSFLLHTSQLLKDPPFIAAMLAFVLVTLRLVSRSYSWPQALGNGAAGGLLAVFIWLARDNMGELLIATVLLSATILVAQQFREKQLRAANIAGMIFLIIITGGVTRVVPKFSKPHPHQVAVDINGPANSLPGGGKIVSPRPGTQSLNPLARIAARVGNVRQRFVSEYPDAASNLDTDVELNSVADLIRYLPRAAVVGFFAPFPNAWLEKGSQVGSAGRLLSGLETLAMYVIEGLAIVGLLNADGGGRRRVSLWLLGLIAALGILSLGLVVVNIGALYRLRYVFLFLLIIMAAGGVTQILERFNLPASLNSKSN
jgi:hypothetical protein